MAGVLVGIILIGLAALGYASGSAIVPGDARREHEPASFWLGVALQAALGLAVLAAGIGALVQGR